MEYLVAVLTIALTVGYAIFIAVNIERGKTWAVEIANAISMLDPQSADHHLRYQARSGETQEATPEAPIDRLAA